MKKKDKQNSVVAFGVHGWFHIIYMMLMFWFYVGMINDGSNNIAGKIAEHMLGSAKMAGTISTCNSIAGIIGVALFIVIGILNRKIGSRYMSGINCIIAGITYIGVLNAPNPVVYTIMMAVTCGTIMSAGYLCGGVLVANWFPKKKGIVMGYTTMGHNLATAIYVPLILFLVGRFGVTRACYPISIGCIILGIVGILFVRDTPFERGYYPDHVSKEVYDEFYDTSDGADSDKNGGWTIGKLLKCDQVWIVALVTGVFQICSVGTMSQMINRTTNGFGFSITVAASIMSACAIVGVVGSFLIGVLDQKLGTKKAMIVFGCWYACALLFNFTDTMAGFWISIVMIGLTFRFLLHIRCKNCNSPCTALTGCLHYEHRSLHCSCHNSLSYPFGQEETTMAQHLVNLHLLFFYQNIHTVYHYILWIRYTGQLDCPIPAGVER